MPIFPLRKITFVASLTNAANDLRHLIRLWEEEDGVPDRPFEKCIITPLFTEPSSLKYVRYIHDHWKVGVMFDSGGFFVQQGKVSYDELFPKLLEYYRRNEWAERYVLPDFVPTTQNSDAEVDERVHVTAAEGVKFLRRMPSALWDRALGVLQGRTPKHLHYCFKAFVENGVPHLGFGSFETTGANAEINLLTTKAAQRLAYLRDLLVGAYSHRETHLLPELHLFGVSTPSSLEQFPQYMATSFDSSGGLRTAGYGNIYLPFQSRRNVTHGAPAMSCGPGMSAAQFYTASIQTGHSCPFCRDFRRLQENRFARMWHNAIVFKEMTDRLNAQMMKWDHEIAL